MHNFGTLYRYEIKKILGRKLTMIVFIVVFALLTAVNIAESVAVKGAAECNDDAIVGRMLDDSLFDEIPNASIRLIYGPTVMEMTMKKAFLVCVGIMLIIGLFYSVFTMLISQIFRNATAPIAIMAILLICSMLNPPKNYRLISQIASYFPATFPGSWTFTDFRLLNLFGLRLNILQALPLIYSLLIIILTVVTVIDYSKAQIKGR